MTYVNMILIPVAIAIVIQLIRYIMYSLNKLHIHKSFYPTKDLYCTTAPSKDEILSGVKQLYLHGKIRYVYLTEQYVSFEDNSPFLSGNVYYILFKEPCALSCRGKTRVYATDKKKLNEMIFYFSHT